MDSQSGLADLEGGGGRSSIPGTEAGAAAHCTTWLGGLNAY